MKFIILGCGSSVGVPWITGNWGKCQRNNKFNIRTRCSAFIKKGDLSILIDTSPDLKKQILDNKIKNSLLNNSIECKSGLTILEVKFERSIPLWFHRIIQSYNLRRQSISKFVLGMCYAKLGTETSD